ncbi:MULTISPECIES: hypothetical protein [unclassified Meiothermus]|uniref:hypothetical protein n=1 Tax=unclassified Meiothermus TaxID=370471 RepID=UPI000D7C284D|nr:MULTISPECIES: hypothetical protein [unclassified Meiothermus]PZA07784.1 hypothetical protein DNA98_05610 [Meiothermus sp. Pnk-1]RYM38914.1 hypothetical protein EWH23_04075 [Meiothermus sp. PNK-Is4]
MAAATEARDTPRRKGEILNLPVKANVKIYQGTLVVRNGGYAAPGSTALNLVALGLATETVDNTGGADGAKRVNVEPGIYRFDNSAAGDAIAETDIGSDCYIVDDSTVAKTNGGGTRSVAGKVWAVDADGVWVKVGF